VWEGVGSGDDVSYRRGAEPRFRGVAG
jgi:hypothetical protein